MINERLQDWGRAQARRVAAWLRWTGLTPNMLTIIGLLLNVVVAAILARGYLFVGGILVIAAGLFDLLDGAMARVTERTSPFGAFLDSTLDRYSEAILYFGLLIYLLDTADARRGALLTFATFVGSIMVSYARARAEGLGYKLQNGLLARPERIIILAAGLILGYPIFALWFLAIFTNVTAAQRIYTLWATTSRAGAAPGTREAGGGRTGEKAKRRTGEGTSGH